MWDAIPSSNSHPAFEGELDFDNVAKVLTKEDPATLLYQRPDYDLSPEKLVDHYGLKSSAYLSMYEQGGYDKVRKGYEMTHRGLFEIVTLPSKNTPQNVGGLRPLAKADGGTGYMHDETVAIYEGFIITTLHGEVIQTLIILNPQCYIPGFIILPTVIRSVQNVGLESCSHLCLFVCNEVTVARRRALCSFTVPLLLVAHDDQNSMLSSVGLGVI